MAIGDNYYMQQQARRPDPGALRIGGPPLNPGMNEASYRAWLANEEAFMQAQGQTPWAGPPPTPNPDRPWEMMSWGMQVNPTPVDGTGQGPGTLGQGWGQDFSQGIGNIDFDAARGALQADIGRVEDAQQRAIGFHQQGVQYIDQALGAIGPQREEMRGLWDDIFGQINLMGQEGIPYMEQAVQLAAQGHIEALQGLQRSLSQQNAAAGRIAGVMGQYGALQGQGLEQAAGAVSYADQAGEAGMGQAQAMYDESLGRYAEGLEAMGTQQAGALGQVDMARAGLLEDRAFQDLQAEQAMADLDAQIAAQEEAKAEALRGMDQAAARLHSDRIASLREMRDNMADSRAREAQAMGAAGQAVETAEQRLTREFMQQAQQRDELYWRRSGEYQYLDDAQKTALGELENTVAKELSAQRSGRMRVLRRQMEDIAQGHPDATPQELETLYDQAKYDQLNEIAGISAKLGLEEGKMRAGVVLDITKARADEAAAFERAFSAQEATQAGARVALAGQAQEARKTLTGTALAAAGMGIQRGEVMGTAAARWAESESALAQARALRELDWQDQTSRMSYLKATARLDWSKLRNAKDIKLAELGQFAADIFTQFGEMGATYRTRAGATLAGQAGEMGRLGLGYATLGTGAREAEARETRAWATTGAQLGLEGERVAQGWDALTAQREAQVQAATARQSALAQAQSAQMFDLAKSKAAYRAKSWNDLAGFNLSLEQLALGGATAMAEIVANTPVLFYTTAKHELGLLGLQLQEKALQYGMQERQLARQDAREQAAATSRTLNTIDARVTRQLDEMRAEQRARMGAWGGQSALPPGGQGGQDQRGPAARVGSRGRELARTGDNLLDEYNRMSRVFAGDEPAGGEYGREGFTPEEQRVLFGGEPANQINYRLPGEPAPARGPIIAPPGARGRPPEPLLSEGSRGERTKNARDWQGQSASLADAIQDGDPATINREYRKFLRIINRDPALRDNEHTQWLLRQVGTGRGMPTSRYSEGGRVAGVMPY